MGANLPTHPASRRHSVLWIIGLAWRTRRRDPHRVICARNGTKPLTAAHEPGRFRPAIRSERRWANPAPHRRDLAYAWLYQGVAHGDEVSTGHFDVNEQYRAAVGVFSHLAVVALETLHYINCLVELGVIHCQFGTSRDPVVANEGDRVFRGLGLLVATQVGNDLSDPAIAASVPEALRPAYQLAQQMVAQRAGIRNQRWLQCGSPRAGAVRTLRLTAAWTTKSAENSTRLSRRRHWASPECGHRLFIANVRDSTVIDRFSAEPIRR